MREKGYDNEVKKCNRMYHKLKAGGNIMRKTVEIPKDYIGAFVGHMPTNLTHPDEDRYLTVRDKDYLKWSINCLLNWDQETTLDNIIHIHGNSDHIFPIKYIKDSIVIENGRHEMIITRAKWFNQNLIKIIEN